MISLLLWRLPHPPHEKAVADDLLVHRLLNCYSVNEMLRPALALKGLRWQKISPKTKTPHGENQSSLEALLPHPYSSGFHTLPRKVEVMLKVNQKTELCES